MEISIGSCDFCLGAESGFQWNLGLYFVDARFSPVNGVITPLSRLKSPWLPIYFRPLTKEV